MFKIGMHVLVSGASSSPLSHWDGVRWNLVSHPDCHYYPLIVSHVPLQHQWEPCGYQDFTPLISSNEESSFLCMRLSEEPGFLFPSGSNNVSPIPSPLLELGQFQKVPNKTEGLNEIQSQNIIWKFSDFN